MLETIQTSLVEITKQYGDYRIQHCQIAASEMTDNRCVLSGTILDRHSFEAVTGELTGRFPSLTFDTSRVQILRQSEARFLTVKTNVTGLHAEPSFRSEMASQLLNGQTVEHLMEKESWAYVRQADGYLGWLYLPYVEKAAATTGAENTHVVCEPISLLRAAPDYESEVAGRVLAGTRVAVGESQGICSCITLAGGASGWVLGEDLLPLSAIPTIASGRREQMVRDGRRYMGVPYLWGGGTAFGIDCSGLVQLLHALAGVTIPRDADMQLDGGQAVEPPFQPGDLLFFGSSGGHRNISHVGMSLGGWRIIHSSRPRNGVYVDDLSAGAGSWLRDNFVGACTYLSDDPGG